MDGVASATNDHRARIKSIQRQRLITVYEQVMSCTPCIQAQVAGSGNYAGIIFGIMMGQKNQEVFLNFDAILI